MTGPLFVATLAIAIVILMREELPEPIARIRRALVENTPLQRFAVHRQLASGFRLLATKLEAGNAPDVALASAAKALTSPRASRVFAHAAIEVADGQSLESCWGSAPSRLRRRLEAPRTLTPARIESIAQGLDRDHERTWQRMARVAGPLALLAIGFAVASSMASILDTWYAIMHQAIDSSTNPLAGPSR
ncbi:MAG: type II secretion system F family protein, partial [Planctomycetes bacterium]|nr:type II secretion system F family protein [Planctomycetota bacterium]